MNNLITKTGVTIQTSVQKHWAFPSLSKEHGSEETKEAEKNGYVLVVKDQNGTRPTVIKPMDPKNGYEIRENPAAIHSGYRSRPAYLCSPAP